eukprot:TRINITY_DN7751_c0_g2_i1.p2 TRINITY_DN7751_c0_g2~~TRINITY_DN7751_c0_g2_i1.p2  ORF type:complete len:126 (-),score=1.93 TRINITY_DN7751_c0_g2_i1:232-609(-)
MVKYKLVYFHVKISTFKKNFQINKLFFHNINLNQKFPKYKIQNNYINNFMLIQYQNYKICYLKQKKSIIGSSLHIFCNNFQLLFFEFFIMNNNQNALKKYQMYNSNQVFNYKKLPLLADAIPLNL